MTDFILGVSFLFFARFFFESLSSLSYKGFLPIDTSTLVHYFLFFWLAIFVFMVFFYFALPSWREHTHKYVPIFFVIIFFAPIFDFVFSGKASVTMGYLVSPPSELFKNLFTFFGPNIHQGITLGLRIEVFLV
jgi:hypothetical protein